MRFYLLILHVLIYLRLSQALNNGLGLTPPMGWMAWQRFRCVTDCVNYPNDCIHENLFKAMADRMAADGYLKAGYEYVLIDDCWSAKERGKNGKLQPDPKRFPSGIEALADYVHSKGLKFGIYGDYGSKTCEGYPGNTDDTLELDAKTFAEWEVDYLKFDGCNHDAKTINKGYKAMSKFLNQTGRPIFFSCSWPFYEQTVNIKPNYNEIAKYCNSWRNTYDIHDNYMYLQAIAEWIHKYQNEFADVAGPGQWNDPDQLLIGNFGLSVDQSEAQMIMWSIMASPLIMSVDLRTIKSEFKDILLNKELIKINQDPLGVQGKFLFSRDYIDIWTKPITPVVNSSTSWAIGLISRRVDGFPRRMSLSLEELHLDNKNGYQIFNILGKIESPCKIKKGDYIVIRLNPTGGVIFKAVPIK